MKLMPASLHRSIALAWKRSRRSTSTPPERQRRDKKSVEQHRSRGNSVVDQRQSEQRDQPERRGRKQSQKKAHECLPIPAACRQAPSRTLRFRAKPPVRAATPPGLALSTLGSRHNGIFSALPCALVFPFCSASFRPESQRKKGRPGKSRPSGCFKGAFSRQKMPRISGDDGEWRFPFRRDAPYYSELPVLAGSIAKPTAFPFAAAPTLMPGRHFF